MANMTIEIRSRRLCLLTVAQCIPGELMPKRWYHGALRWLWSRVVFEYRLRGMWYRLPQPALRLD